MNTWQRREAEDMMKEFLATMISSDTIICMVLHYSGEKYYKQALPYLEKFVGQPITADLEYGESWALLGYKGIHSPVPHWRESVRSKIGLGPSIINKIITLRKG
jgi:hypothetical protein